MSHEEHLSRLNTVGARTVHRKFTEFLQNNEMEQKIDSHLDSHWKELHGTMQSLLKAQEENYFKAVSSFLGRKEAEFRAVTEELTHRAQTEDYRQSIIERLQSLISRLGLEGN